MVTPQAHDLGKRPRVKRWGGQAFRRSNSLEDIYAQHFNIRLDVESGDITLHSGLKRDPMKKASTGIQRRTWR